VEIVKTPAPRPALVDAETQTDMEIVEQTQADPSLQRRPYKSLSQRPKKHSIPPNLRRRVSNIWTTQLAASDEDHLMRVTDNSPVLETMDKDGPRQEWVQSQKPCDDEDIGMTDHGTTGAPEDGATTRRHASTTSTHAVALAPMQASYPLIQPPDPLWYVVNNQSGVNERHHRHDANPASMHVDIPPPPLFNSISSAESYIFATPNTMLSSTHLSPSTFGTAPSPPPSVFFPPPLPTVTSTTNSITQPSPIKKKMSLSDYMNKRKSETPALEKTLSQTHQAEGLPPGARQSIASVHESAIEESINHLESGGTPPP